MLGPTRKETQVEILVSDAFKLGIPVNVRLSGDLENTSSCKIVGSRGEVILEKGVIIALRHLHLSSDEALEYKLKD